jgi:hypothetical protein
MVEQLSVFLENTPGRLAEMARAIGDAGVNMRALMVAETGDYGVVRVLCDRPHEARDVLDAAGFSASLTRVIAVEVPDRPGGLADVVEALGAAGLNVEYAYCFVEPRADAAVYIFRVEDPDRASEVLGQAGIGVVAAEVLYSPDSD